jgi:hypothetical protein
MWSCIQGFAPDAKCAIEYARGGDEKAGSMRLAIEDQEQNREGGQEEERGNVQRPDPEQAFRVKGIIGCAPVPWESR